jgi:hypothetical protein
MKRSFYLLFYFVIGSSLLFSCNGNADPESSVRIILDTLCQRQSHGCLKIVNYEKKDGVKEKRNGVDYYIIQFDFEVEGVKDGGYGSCGNNDESGNCSLTSLFVSEQKRDSFFMPIMNGKIYRISDVITDVPKKMILAKHETGWVNETPR